MPEDILPQPHSDLPPLNSPILAFSEKQSTGIARISASEAGRSGDYCAQAQAKEVKQMSRVPEILKGLDIHTCSLGEAQKHLSTSVKRVSSAAL